MAHSSVENLMHIIFSAKNRDPIIHPNIENRLYAYLGGLASKRKSPIIRINGTQNHIHLLLKLHPDVPLSTLIRELKSYSTGWLKKEGYTLFSWQIGYGGHSCLKPRIDRLIEYIDNQKKHHENQTFEEELNILKQKYGVNWN